MASSRLIPFLATAGMALATQPACAADIYKNAGAGGAKDPVAVDMTAPFAGFYLGANAGYAVGEVSVGDTDGYNSGDGWSYDAEAAHAGVQLGYNWQTGRFLVGVEGDLGYMNYLGLDDDGADPSSLGGDTRSSINGGFYGALTGRLGVVSGATLFYAKGGLAFLNAEVNVDDGCADAPCGPATLEVNREDTLTGWTVGGGIEHAISSKWSVKAEYLYYDFGTIDAEGITSGLETVRFEHDVTAHTVKIGVNRLIGATRSTLP